MENRLNILNHDFTPPNINYSYTNTNLLKTYKASGNYAIKNKLILLNLQLVKKIASKYSLSWK